MQKFQNYESNSNVSKSNESKPIETMYKGIRFRSRLEARWAVFLDECGAEWEYEPEGYALNNGMKYLPDFLVQNVRLRGGANGRYLDMFFEVKGRLTSTDLSKVQRFANIPAYYEGQEHPIMILGNIPDPSDPAYDMLQHSTEYIFSFAFIDGDEWPAGPVITETGEFGVLKLDQNEEPPYMDVEKTEAAYMAARSKRFEYTEADITPLEKEVEVLRKRAELEEEKRQLIHKIQGGR